MTGGDLNDLVYTFRVVAHEAAEGLLDEREHVFKGLMKVKMPLTLHLLT